MVRIRIEAKADYVLKIARLSDPISGLAEMIWNSLDAEARLVKVHYLRNAGGGIEGVTVVDSGHGMPYASCTSYFQGLGGSWKASARVSPNLKLSLHGRSGQGRLTGFALGSHVKWTTVAANAVGQLEQTTIRGSISSPTDFDIDGPIRVADDSPTGTIFEANFPGEFIQRLDSPAGRESLERIFAPFVAANSEVRVEVDNTPLDPSRIWLDSALYVLEVDQTGEVLGVTRLTDEMSETDKPVLRIVEWPHATERTLALCDRRGIELETVPVGIQKPGVNFSAYLLWDGFRDHLSEILLAELGDNFSSILHQARETIKEHLAERDQARRKEQVDSWKAEKVYPFITEAASATEAAERQVFDEVATVISRKLPHAKAAKRISLRLLREALSSDPARVPAMIDELFKLPKPDQDELRRLLSRTSLSHLVRAAAEVTGRLDFLRALKLLVYEPQVSNTVRERSELHKIVERETWIFGEQFHLMASDKSLDECLRRHMALMGRRETAPHAVRREDGSVGIVDLMLGAMRRGTLGREHLVVELKAPRVKIRQGEVGQIKSYAEAVASDPEFSMRDVRWDFMIISTDMDEITRRDARQPSLPEGCISEWGNNVRIWALTWGEVIEECERRLHYFQQSLNHDPALEHATDYLRRVHGESVRIDLDRVEQKSNRSPQHRS